MSGSNALPEITLDELERLIRILGMLGSSSDGEVVAAARFATKWVTEHATDWRTLLSPPEEALPVTGVVAMADPDEAKTREAAAYRNGYAAGMRDMGAQLKAQAAMTSHGATGQAAAHQGQPGWAAAAAQAATGHSPFTQPVRPAQAAQGPVRGSGAVSGGTSWQAVCKQLLDRAQSIPGVFRGSREQTFVTDLLARGYPTLTPAQDKWLRDIAGRNSMSW